MSGETDLARLLATMAPALVPGRYVFGTGEPPPGVVPRATVVEDEGLSFVITEEEADAAGLAYDFVGAWITLRVHSALAAVGLTAAVSTALAGAGISCNVIAGHHHDHLLVPADRAEQAIEVLRATSG